MNKSITSVDTFATVLFSGIELCFFIYASYSTYLVMLWGYQVQPQANIAQYIA